MSAKILPFVTREEKILADIEADVINVVKGIKASFTEEELEQIRLDLEGEDNEL